MILGYRHARNLNKPPPTHTLTTENKDEKIQLEKSCYLRLMANR